VHCILFEKNYINKILLKEEDFSIKKCLFFIAMFLLPTYSAFHNSVRVIHARSYYELEQLRHLINT